MKKTMHALVVAAIRVIGLMFFVPYTEAQNFE